MPTTQLPLKDIHIPEAIGWWPPAIGWWLLAILIPALIVLLYWLFKFLTRKTAIKAAKKNLDDIKQNYALDNITKLRELSMLIRRVSISVNPRTEVASLTGRQWLAFLDKSVTCAPFSEGCGQLLADAPYRNTPPTEQEISQLIDQCEDWLKAQTKQAKRKQKS
ncbi:MAG: DUF4381 domain-containing protein [Methylococcales bacterium]|nr:DUF4381 domain-containing protein [Methylococcales bacterium]